jgi:hypothetical protein
MLIRFSTQVTAIATSNWLMRPIPLALGATAALVAVLWRARRDLPVVLPLALFLYQPDWQPWAFGYLAAAPRLHTAA